jgi:acyl carrier protein
MSEVESKVKEIIMDKLGTSEEKITPEASFRNDLGADSLSTVELMMELEDAFGIDIEDEEAEKIQTVKDAIAYIENKMAEKKE